MISRLELLWVLTAIVAGTGTAGIAVGETLTVPGDYASIQSAIGAAEDGDMILVSPGTYLETISFSGKAIHVMSVAGAADTVIDGAGAGTVVSFTEGEGALSILEGFTVTGGTGTNSGAFIFGGGILCDGASPEIRDNIITSNVAPTVSSTGGCGGGVALRNSSALLEGNIIVSNDANNGGGVHVVGGTPTLLGNEISGNTSIGGGGIAASFSSMAIVDNVISGNIADALGGGVALISFKQGTTILFTGNVIADNVVTAPIPNYPGTGGGVLTFDVEMEFSNNIVARNSSLCGAGCEFGFASDVFGSNNLWYENTATSEGGGLRLLTNVDLDLANSILWGNQAPAGAQILEFNPDTVTLSYCDVEGGWPGIGNIDVDPGFVDAASSDFHLDLGSPLIDVGSASFVYLPATDFEGDARLIGANVDIGPDEVVCAPPGCLPFVRGDVTGDGFIAIDDPISVLNHLFVTGAPLPCFDGADFGDDGVLGIDDPLQLLSHLFGGGAPPAPPHPACGPDVDDSDPFDCQVSPCF